MTKPDFLHWLEQCRRVDNIKRVVEERSWSETELDRLKATLEHTGRLKMKDEAKRRMAWG